MNVLIVSLWWVQWILLSMSGKKVCCISAKFNILLSHAIAIQTFSYHNLSVPVDVMFIVVDCTLICLRLRQFVFWLWKTVPYFIMYVLRWLLRWQNIEKPFISQEIPQVINYFFASRKSRRFLPEDCLSQCVSLNICNVWHYELYTTEEETCYYYKYYTTIMVIYLLKLFILLHNGIKCSTKPCKVSTKCTASSIA